MSGKTDKDRIKELQQKIEQLTSIVQNNPKTEHHYRKLMNKKYSKNNQARYKDIKYVSENDIRKLFRTIAECKPKKGQHNYPEAKILYRRNIAMFHLAYYLGLRVSEVGQIRFQDYKRDQRKIYVRSLKGSIRNMQKLDPPRMSAIEDYISARGKNKWYHDDPLFTSRVNRGVKPISRVTVQKLLYTFAEIAGWPREYWNFHTLRHSMAIHLAEKGYSLKELQERLRHTNLNSTMIYFRYTTAQQDAAYTKEREAGGMVR